MLLVLAVCSPSGLFVFSWKDGFVFNHLLNTWNFSLQGAGSCFRSIGNVVAVPLTDNNTETPDLLLISASIASVSAF